MKVTPHPQVAKSGWYALKRAGVVWAYAWIIAVAYLLGAWTTKDFCTALFIHATAAFAPGYSF